MRKVLVVGTVLMLLTFSVFIVHGCDRNGDEDDVTTAPGSVSGVDCIEFENLTLNTQYNNTQQFVCSNTQMTVEPFEWSPNNQTTSGFVKVVTGGNAGVSGQELNINNANLRFKFSESLSGLTLNFGEYGGNLNIEINTNFLNFEDFVNIHNSTMFGDVEVTVINGLGNDTGRLTLKGHITDFAIGGQELFIDHVCPQ